MGKVSKGAVIESVWKFISTMITKVGALIFVILIARFLKPEGFGIYNLAMSIVLTLTIITDLGVNKTLLRYVSYSLGKKNKKQASAYTRYLFKLKLTLTIAFSVLLLTLSYPISFFLFKKPDLFLPLVIVSFYLIVLSFENFFEYFFYAIKKVKYLSINQAILQSLRIFLALLVFTILTDFNQIIGVLIAIILAHFIVLLFSLVILKKHAGFLFKKTDSRINKKKLFKFLKYLAVAGLSAMFFAYVDIIMLGIFLPSDYVGYYSAAVALVGTFIMLLSISNVLLPIFTQLKDSQLKDSFDKVFRYICMFSIPTIFGVLALGKYFIRAIYGYDYLLATVPLYLLSILLFSEVSSDVIISLFSARGKPKYFVKILIIASILNVVLNYALIKSFLSISLEWAMAGAAIATISSRYFYLFSLGFIANKKLKIRFNKKYFLKPFIAGAFMFIGLISINHFVNDMTIIKGIGQVLLGVVIYLALMILFKGIGREDYLLIKEIRGCKLKND